jgi:hypothetical protein
VRARSIGTGRLKSSVSLDETDEQRVRPPLVSDVPILAGILRIAESVTGSGAPAADMKSLRVATGTIGDEATSLVFEVGFAEAPIGTKLGVDWWLRDGCQGEIRMNRLDGGAAKLWVGCADPGVISESKEIATIPIVVDLAGANATLTIDLRALTGRARELFRPGDTLDELRFTTWAAGDMGPSDSAPDDKAASYRIAGRL